MALRRVFTIAWKDVLVVLRDIPSVAVLLGMPIVLILILSMALSGVAEDFDPVDVAVIDRDGSEVSREITGALLENDDLRELIAARGMSDAEEARRLVREGDLAAILVIPAGFGDTLEGGRQATLQVEVDPGQQVAAGIFRSVVDSVSSRLSAAVVAAKTSSEVLAESKMVSGEADAHRYVDAAIDAAVDDELDSVRVRRSGGGMGDGAEWDALDYYGAGMSVMFLNFGAMFGAFALLRERTEETLGRLLTAPVSRAVVLAGKALAILAVGIVQFAVLYLFALSIGTDWGSPLGVFAVAASQVLAATGLAVALAAFGKSQRGAGAIGPVVILLMAAAGGSWMPVAQMPSWLQPVHYFTINGWSLDAMLALQEGAALARVLPNMAALAAIGLVLFALGTWRLRWER